mgnify:CR=1 FL=1
MDSEVSVLMLDRDRLILHFPVFWVDVDGCVAWVDRFNDHSGAFGGICLHLPCIHPFRCGSLLVHGSFSIRCYHRNVVSEFPRCYLRSTIVEGVSRGWCVGLYGLVQIVHENAKEDWEKGDEEHSWDPDFEEFDIPKSKGKAAGKKKADEEDDFKIDEDFKEFDMMAGGDDFDDDDDDF